MSRAINNQKLPSKISTPVSDHHTTFLTVSSPKLRPFARPCRLLHLRKNSPPSLSYKSLSQRFIAFITFCLDCRAYFRRFLLSFAAILLRASVAQLIGSVDTAVFP